MRFLFRHIRIWQVSLEQGDIARWKNVENYSRTRSGTVPLITDIWSRSCPVLLKQQFLMVRKMKMFPGRKLNFCHADKLRKQSGCVTLGPFCNWLNKQTNKQTNKTKQSKTKQTNPPTSKELNKNKQQNNTINNNKTKQTKNKKQN